ncbi:MAG: hypothetical protein K8S98_09135 [Planctomycetes bacterium]|nr:hypothetical protein [Planctomycetota bacterium]
MVNDNIVERFDALGWHDSKLIGVSIRRRGEEEQVCLVTRFQAPTGEYLEPIEVVFSDAHYVHVDVDLVEKRYGSDHVSDAECHTALPDWFRSMAVKNRWGSLDGFLHFEFGFAVPGRIDIVAREFAVGPGTA